MATAQAPSEIPPRHQDVAQPAPSSVRSTYRMNIERPNRVTWAADSNLEDERAAYWDLLRQFHDRHRDAIYDQHFTIWFRSLERPVRLQRADGHE